MSFGVKQPFEGRNINKKTTQTGEKYCNQQKTQKREPFIKI